MTFLRRLRGLLGVADPGVFLGGAALALQATGRDAVAFPLLCVAAGWLARGVAQGIYRLFRRRSALDLVAAKAEALGRASNARTALARGRGAEPLDDEAIAKAGRAYARAFDAFEVALAAYRRAVLLGAKT